MKQKMMDIDLIHFRNMANTSWTAVFTSCVEIAETTGRLQIQNSAENRRSQLLFLFYVQVDILPEKST